MKVHALTIGICSFAAGIFLSSFVPILPLVAVLIIAVGTAILLVQKEAFLVALILISVALGIIRYDIKDFHDVMTPTAHGIVVSEPEDKESTRQFTYQSDNGEKVLVSVPLYTPVAYGDEVQVSGKPARPGVINGFDYGAYLSKDDIYWTENFSKVSVLAHGKGNRVKAALYAMKHNFVAHIDKILPEPSAGLLAGFLVAGKEALPQNILDDFKRAGVIHIVVLSGFNVTLIAQFILRLTLSRVAALLGVVAFILMTGASASVVRAGIMAIVALMAKFIGRAYSAPRALIFAAFFMLLENPKILVFDPSFQLSFLATLGLIYLMGPIERRLHFLPEKFQFKEIVSQTIATQLAVLLLLIYSTGHVSLVSLPANIFILPFVPATMLVGFAAAVLSYIHVIVAWPVSFASHILLTYILFAAHFFSSLPFATISVPL